MRLSDDQMRELCARRDVGVLASAASSEPRAADLLKNVPSEDRRTLVADGVVARNKMVEANLGLVWSIVRKSAPLERHRQDYEQEGVVALIHAADRYDPNRGASLATYAYPHIKGAVLNAISMRGGELHLNESQARAKELVRSAAARLTSAGAPALSADVAEYLGRSEEWVIRHQNYVRPIHLSTAEFGEIQVEDESAQQQVEAVKDQPITRYLALLPEAERAALELVHGVGGEPHSLVEASTILGVSLSTLERRVVSGQAKLGMLVSHFDQDLDEGQPTARRQMRPAARTSPDERVLMLMSRTR